MSTDRGRRRTSNSGRKGRDRSLRPDGVQLAPGVKLDGGEGREPTPERGPEPFVLVWPGGKAELNEGAVTILRLCDGSRSRAEIVAEVVRQSPGSTLASDISEFLDVARARGWIIEP